MDGTGDTEPLSDSRREMIQLAARIVGAPNRADMAAEFGLKAAACEDIAWMDDLSRRFMPYPTVVAPLCDRLIALDGNDMELRARVGQSYFFSGEDDQATRILEELRAREPEHPRVLELSALLESDHVARRRIYARLLQLEPGNKMAWEQLLLLRDPE